LKFSWRALILAPLLVPLVLSLGLAIAMPGRSPFLGFLFFFVLGSVFAYGVAIFLFLPGLYLVSRFWPLTVVSTSALGALIGGLGFVAFARISYGASGNDSGPPEGTFGEYLWRDLSGPTVWAFVVAGAITAFVYWFLVSRALLISSSSSSK
jgi:hypothetical protein